MTQKKSFTVTQPPVILWLFLVLMGLFLVPVVIHLLVSPPPHTAMIIVTSVFIFLPCTLIILWAKFFKIEVSGTTIKVRKRFGIVNFCFDVSEITKVKYKIVQNQMGENQKITIVTSKGKKVPVETLMVNSKEMVTFIESNVDQSKIEKTVKVFR